jgi:YbgC/YbaW family acyl-CoA thioester hydrolase
MTPPFRISRRVEFGDTDSAGIMHFSNFFRFMEVAETDFLRSLGVSVTWRPGGQPVGFPRVAASCDYLAPARFEDVLDVAVSLVKIGRKSLTYRFDVSRGGEPIAVGRISAVCCRGGGEGKRLESVEIPPEIRAKLEPYLIQEPD